MRLKRIYASKLYVTSTRKDRIHAAMQDPVNAELVKQLSEYLDDDAKKQLNKVLKKQKAEDIKNNPEKSSGGFGDDEPFASPSGGGGSHHFSGDVMSDFGDGDELSDIEMPDEGGAPDTPPAPDEPIESVTQEGKKITATSWIWTTIEDVTKECDIIQGTLNAREDTKGVSRLQVMKDSELWVYYNDDSNLNDKMVEVISVLNASGYTYLKFNRLARSNNAIVFDILLNDNEDIKSRQQIEEVSK